MNAERNNSDDRLERLLRQWGNRQAVEQADAPPAVAPRWRGSVVAVIGRWAPLAAAAVLVIAAAGLFSMSRHNDQWVDMASEGEAQPIIAPPTPSEEADSDKDEADKQIALLTAQLAELESARADEQAEYQRLAGETQLLEQQLADADGQVTEETQRLQQLLLDADQQLTDAETEMAALRRQGELEKQELLALVDQANEDAAMQAEAFRQARLRATAAEVAPAPADSAPAVSEAEPATAQPVLSADIVALYLAIAAPGQEGMSAVQAAATNRRLTDRCMTLRQQAEDQTTRRLLDRLEVVLTQLEMLDPDDERAARALVELTKAQQMREMLTEAIGRSGDDERRQFLLEVQLIFRGVDSVA